MKLRQLLITAFLFVGVIPAVAGLYLYNDHASDRFQDAMAEKLEAISMIAKQRILAVLDRIEDNNALITSRTQMRISLKNWNDAADEAAKARINRILNDATGGMTRLKAIAVFDPEGTLVTATRQYDSFARVDSSIDNIRPTRLTYINNALEMHSTSPLELNGEHIGYMVSLYTADFLQEMVSDRTGLGDTGEWLFAVRNRDGDAVFGVALRHDQRAAFRRTIPSERLDVPITQALLGNETLMRQAPDYLDVPVMAYTRYILEVDWGLVAKINEEEVAALTADANRQALLIAGIVSLVAVLLGLGLATYLARPIEGLTRASDALARGDFDARPDIKGWKEAETLAASFANMAAALKDMRDNLNHKVEDRTRLLEHANEELKAVNRELDGAVQLAEQASRTKSEFLASMSHELRTPMNGIIGAAGLLKETTQDSRQNYYTETVLSSAEAMMMLINELLDISKIEAGKLELEMIPFDIQEVIEDIASLMAPKCGDKGIELLVHVPTDLPRDVIGDPSRLRQVLLNLIGNAIKFTNEGHVLLSIAAHTVPNGQLKFVLSVTDTGIGIANENLEKVFQKFEQAESSTTRKYGGTGLGLPICRELVKLMGGDLGVKSKLDEGSTFTFDLTLDQAEEKAKRQNVDVTGLKGLRLLVVDDSHVSQEIVHDNLEGMGLEIETVASAEDALRRLEEGLAIGKPFNLLLTDFCMPEKDGMELITDVKKDERFAGLHSVMMTSSPKKGEAVTLSKLGLRGYISKPIFPGELATLLSAVWETRDKADATPLLNRYSFRQQDEDELDTLNLSGAKVLLVEDNHVNRVVATKRLQKYGCAITPAGDGIEALRQFEDTKFDLILMDCQMPEMDGYEATREIRKIEKMRKLEPTPIIAFTANAMEQDKRDCLNAGMNDFISKPIDVKILEQKLNHWLPDFTPHAAAE